jgi:hypothetical protein
MENQHRKIAGYRELSQADIDLMNEIKALGPVIEAVLEKVKNHIPAQDHAVYVSSGSEFSDEIKAELDRIVQASPCRWINIAKTDFQTGLMALTRAVAQPTFF